MVKIKICGIKNKDEIRIINKYKPDFAGFIFYPESKRYITPQKAQELIKTLHPEIRRAGVFVNCPVKRVNLLRKQLGLDVVQIHGDENLDYFRQLEPPFWKVFRISDSLPEGIDRFRKEVCLLDTFRKDQYGGNGQQFDYSILKELDDDMKVIVAGGINIDSVKSLLEVFHPYCIDINSGVETNGQKDDEKVKSIIRYIRKLTENEVSE